MIATFSNVTKHYSSGEGITDVSFSIPKGQVIGLLGINGSGKSTTMKLLSGLLQAQRGEVLINATKPRASRHNVAFLGDRLGFSSWMNPSHMSRFMETFYDDFDVDKFKSLIQELKIPPKPLSEMSKGQQQKLKLAATMARQVHLYLLDEPLSGIDLIARTGILKSLVANWDKNSSIVMATHEIKDVEPFLDRSLFLAAGSLQADEDTKTITANGTTVAERFIEIMEPNS